MEKCSNLDFIGMISLHQSKDDRRRRDCEEIYELKECAFPNHINHSDVVGLWQRGRWSSVFNLVRRRNKSEARCNGDEEICKSNQSF